MSLLLIGVVAGVFTGLNGIKAGWLGAIAATVGIMLKSALTLVWMYWLCGFVLAGTMLAALASVLFKNRAIQSLVVGIQKGKEAVANAPSTNIDTRAVINSELQAAQTTSGVQKIIKRVKADLKLKGKI
jgi:hypothetical protein